jgi:hypothetical protein
LLADKIKQLISSLIFLERAGAYKGSLYKRSSFCPFFHPGRPTEQNAFCKEYTNFSAVVKNKNSYPLTSCQAGGIQAVIQKINKPRLLS